MFERFSGAARTVVQDARYEAGRRGDRRLDTEHLLIALLEDDVLAAALGADASAARHAADELDHQALQAIGFDCREVPRTRQPAIPRRMPLTAGAKAALGGMLSVAGAERAQELTSRHLLLALLDRPAADPVVAVLTALHVDRPAARARVADQH